MPHFPIQTVSPVRMPPPVPLFDPVVPPSHPPAEAPPDLLSPEISEENREIQTDLPRVWLTKEQCFNKVRQKNFARVRQALEAAKSPVFLDFSDADPHAGEIRDEIFKQLSAAAKANIAYLHLGSTTIAGISLKGFNQLRELDVRKIFLSTAGELRALVDTTPTSTKIWVTERQKVQLTSA